MTGPVPLPKQYPAHLQLCYRGVRYRPAALQLFVARGGWGPEYMPIRRREQEKIGFRDNGQISRQCPPKRPDKACSASRQLAL